MMWPNNIDATAEVHRDLAERREREAALHRKLRHGRGGNVMERH